MKSQNSNLIILLILMLTISSCDDYYHDCIRGNGPTITEDRIHEGFSSIYNEIHADLHITQGESFEVSIRGSDDVVSKIRTNVNGSELNIDSRYCFRNADVDIFITMPAIVNVANSGSGDILGTNLWVVDDIKLSMSGSGNIRTDVEADDVEAKISGSGDISITGSCDFQTIKISGSGKVSNFGLLSENADVTISGSGRCEVNVAKNLDVSISGSGSVYYKGNPNVNWSVSGSGRVINAN